MLRFVLTVLAYLIPTFALGFVWHLKLFEATYRELRIYREGVIIPFGFGSMLIQGLVFAVAYPRLVPDPPVIACGLVFAGAAAILSWSFTTLAVAAKYPMSSVRRFVAIETAFTAIQFLLVGPLLALAARVG